MVEDGALRVAILGINYAPEEIGIARYTTDMAVALAARGHHVEVIVGKPYYPQWTIYGPYRKRGWHRDVERGIRVTRCPHYVPAVPNGPRRIAHLASFAVSALGPALRLAFRRGSERPQVIICVVPALLSVPVAWLAARLARAKLWVHVQDLEVETAFATGLIADSGIIARLAQAVENGLLRLADRISTISPQMCAKLLQKSIEPARVVQIRNWAEPAPAPAPGDTGDTLGLRESWGLGGQHVALYSGNIANKQGIEILIEAARISAHRTDISWVISGEGPNRERLEKLATGLDNVQFHDLQPTGRMPELLAMADVHLLPQIPGAADLLLPSKLTNMLASGRPVVATTTMGTGLYDEVEGCGVTTPPGDAASLARAVCELIDDPERRQVLGVAGKHRARKRWGREHIIDRLEKELQRVCRNEVVASTNLGSAL
ncbi:MAG: WcaI family glycosyltransferase [Pseudomonadota bacterium]|nr:WcaI family glycosyltransferase [Pseudomonadota bacterium]